MIEYSDSLHGRFFRSAEYDDSNYLTDGAGKAGAVDRIAVFNYKGGTGKTTTAVNLAAGFAEAGERVLLIDTDAQGQVGASLGIRSDVSLYHVLVEGQPLSNAVIPVRPGWDVITSNELMLLVEGRLSQSDYSVRPLEGLLRQAELQYDVIIIDCAPGLSWLNESILASVNKAIIPIACDYLSIVGVRKVLRSMRRITETLGHLVSFVGILPTFYDARANICREAIDTLKDYFGDQCLSPIRANTKIKEAPSVRKSIFEYAGASRGALDYRTLVDELLRQRQSEMAPAQDYGAGAVLANEWVAAL